MRDHDTDKLQDGAHDPMRAGLVSVSFRKLTARELVEVAAASGLSCLEWGGDIHVPHGDCDTAREVAKMTRDQGLEVAAYGSYYALGQSESQGLSFAAVLETAKALEAPTIRVWAGRQGSGLADVDYRNAVVADALRVADLAQEAGLSIGYELHANTLTDTMESTRSLLAATEHSGIQCLWQPAVGLSEEECLASLDVVMARLSHVHAYYWWPEATDRLPLASGRDGWRRYLARMRAAGRDPDVLLEFVPGDDPAVLGREAATLCELLDETNSPPG